MMNAGGPPLEAESLHAFGNRTGAHQHDFLAERAQLCDLRRPFCDRRMIEAAPVVGDQRRADLDDQASCGMNHVVHVATYSMTLKRGSSGSIDTMPRASSTIWVSSERYSAARCSAR